MAWIELHQALVTHRKMVELCDELDISTAEAIGHLAIFWLWALDNLPEGGPVSGRMVERTSQWEGPRGTWSSALVEVGFIDDIDGELYVHDWGDYAGRLIQARKFHVQRQALHRDKRLRDAIRARDGDRCRYCGQLVRWGDRRGRLGGTYDHVKPRGPNTYDNVVVACRACNSSKGGRTPDEAGMPLLELDQFEHEPAPSQNSSRTDLATVPNRTVPNLITIGGAESDDDSDGLTSPLARQLLHRIGDAMGGLNQGWTELLSALLAQGFEQPDIEYAIDQAVQRNARNPAYVNAIMEGREPGFAQQLKAARKGGARGRAEGPDRGRGSGAFERGDRSQRRA